MNIWSDSGKELQCSLNMNKKNIYGERETISSEPTRVVQAAGVECERRMIFYVNPEETLSTLEEILK